MGSLIWVPEICLTWRLRQFKPKFVLVLEWDGGGGPKCETMAALKCQLGPGGAETGLTLCLSDLCLSLLCRWCDSTPISGYGQKSSVSPVSSNRRGPCTSSNMTSGTQVIAFVNAHQGWQAVSYGEMLERQKMWLATHSIREDKISWCLEQVNNQAKFKFITAPDHGLRMCL